MQSQIDLPIVAAVEAVKAVVATANGKPLEQRLLLSMRFVRNNVNKVFWLFNPVDVTEDAKLKIAVAAVIELSNQTERTLIIRSLQTLYSIVIHPVGTPMNRRQLAGLNSIIPILDLWAKSREPVC